MKLEKQELTLSTGKKAFYEYDPETDMLEIVFRQGQATCAVELTESIILRFDGEMNEPLSLSFISISRLVKPGEYGETHFQLLTEEWPEEAKEKLLAMLREAPLTDFLTLSSYAPAHSHQIIPLAAIKQLHLSPLAA